jgi:hypothetical protein
MSYHQRLIAVYKAVYYIAHHFRVTSKGVSTLQKDSMYNRGRVGSLAHVELRTITGSTTLLQFGGASWKLALTATGGL